VSSSNFIIGKLLNAHSLGLFSRADQVANLPLQKIASTFSSVMFPIYSSVQNDNERLANAYLKTVAAIAVLTAPPLAVIAVSADIVIAGLYGEKWIEAAPILALLSIAGIFVCVFHLAGALVEATNRVLDEIRQQIIYLIIVVGGFIFAAKFGLVAVAWVFLLGVLYLYFAMGNLALLIIQKSWGLYLKAQLPGYAIAAILALLIWLCLPALDLLAISTYPIKLALVIAASGVLYLAALFVTPDAWLFGAKGMLMEKFLRKKNPPESL
jgi:O-antigen/teichoic acid export membrane protein